MPLAVNPFLHDDVPPFSGFPEDALVFFRELKKNNNRDWFAKNKERFENSARLPMESLLSSLRAKLQVIDPEIAVDPKRSVYRIYRDTRFSKDKTPFKTWIAASFAFAGKNRKSDAGYYFHISDDEFLIAGGLYSPSSDQLKSLRAAIDRDASPLRALLRDKKAKKLFGDMQGDSLARVPQGYDKEHPDADLLRRKQFLYWKTIDPSAALDPKLPDLLVKHFAAMTPFLRWLADNS